MEQPQVEKPKSQEIHDETGQPVKFDLDKLASDIDTTFQVVLEKNAKEMTGIGEDALNQYKQGIKLELESINDRLIEEVKKGRTVINLGEGVSINIQHMDHPMLEPVVESLNLFKQAMLVGPAGTGKSYMITELANRMNLPFYKYSCSRDSAVHDLLGYKQPRSEEYLETVFIKAYETGGIFLVDEYDAMSGDMALFFNGVCDGSKFISIPHRDEKPTAVKHKDFYIVMCGNTWGKGSHEYSGRDFQDNALMDRFRLCRHYVGYHIELEKSLVGDKWNQVKKLRSNLERVSSYLSTRNVEQMAILWTAGKSDNEVIEKITADLTEAERKEVKKNRSTSNAQTGASWSPDI